MEKFAKFNKVLTIIMIVCLLLSLSLLLIGALTSDASAQAVTPYLDFYPFSDYSWVRSGYTPTFIFSMALSDIASDAASITYPFYNTYFIFSNVDSDGLYSDTQVYFVTSFRFSMDGSRIDIILSSPDSIVDVSLYNDGYAVVSDIDSYNRFWVYFTNQSSMNYYRAFQWYFTDQSYSISHASWSKQLPYDLGYKAGQQDNTAYDSGYSAGLSDGYDNGYQAGYEVGYASPYSSDFTDLIKAEVESPFYMISKAFDFEVFGINFKALIFGLLSLGISIFVIKIILKFVK